MAEVSVGSGSRKAEMKGSLESQAFRKHFSELCIVIGDPEWLASELFSMDMISNDALDEAVTVMGVSRTHKTRRVLCHFKGSLASNPEYFQKFIATLKSSKHLDWIANRVEATYGRLIATLHTLQFLFHKLKYALFFIGKLCSLTPMKTGVIDRSISDVPSCSADTTHPQTSSFQSYATPNIEKYSVYLKSFYKQRPLPVSQKWPPAPGKKYINLAIICSGNASLSEAYEMTSAKLHCNIDLILKKKDSISIDKILCPEGDELIKCILVEGSPGVGKSTFAWELCQKWDKLPRQFSLVILIHLRDKRVKAAKQLEDILYHRNSDLRTAVAKDIEDINGENVLFIFDGFDELPPSQRDVGSLFTDIINGVYLPQATVIVTSRPSVTAELIACCKPQISKHVEILGFTEENVNEYAKSVFTSSQFEDFKKYIYSSPILLSMMYIPINTVIVVEIYRQNMNTNQVIPRTLTQLYDALTHALLRRHMVDRGILNSSCRIPQTLQALPGSLNKTFRDICELSFNGICQQKLTWNDLPDDYEDLGLMSKESSLHVETGCEVSYSFLHLTLQEYLAAFHISVLPHYVQECIFQENGHLPYFHVVWRFLAGLTGFSQIGWNAVWLKYQEESPGWLNATYCLQPLYVHCLYESQTSDGALQCGTETTNVGFLPSTISPFDCIALSNCIARSICRWTLDFISAGITCDDFKMFVYGLSRQKKIGGSIHALRIGRNHMGFEGIKIISTLPKSILTSIPVLKLYSCNLDATACNELGNLIPHMKGLAEMDIGENPIQPGGCVLLLQSLYDHSHRQLRLLGISSVNLGPTDISIVSMLINPSHGRLLTLKIGDENMTCDSNQLLLMSVLGPSTLQELDIRGTDLTPHSKIIRSQLKNNKNLEIIQLMWCKIGSDVAVSIAESLAENEALIKLHIRHPSIGIYSKGASALAQMIKSNHHLQEIVLNDDTVNENLAYELKESGKHLKILKIEN